MIGGQVADLEGEGQPPDAPNCSKASTAPRPARCCAPACAWAPSMPARAEAQLDALSCYGEHIGLAFQIIDDILDVEESSEALGKTAGKDAQQQKITFPAVYGLTESRAMAEARMRQRRTTRSSSSANARSGCTRLADLIVQPQMHEGLAARPAAGRARSGRIARESAGADPGRGSAASTGVKAQKPGQSVAADADLEVLEPAALRRPRRPQARRRAGAVRHRCRRPRLPRCRRIHRRLHRLPAAARRRAGPRRRCRRRPARLEAAQRSARRRARAASTRAT